MDLNLSQFDADGAKRLTSDASTLGFAPGQWPTQFSLHGTTYRYDKPQRRDGDLLAVEYVAADGRTATIYND